MKSYTLLKHSLVFLLAGLIASADVIETKDGARLVGTVAGINGGKITLKTSYAGDIEVDQAEVVSLTMDDALAIRLDDGTTMEGTIAALGEGEIEISGNSGSVSSPVTGVAATWDIGGEDPAVTALRRGWSYEASADITGKSGNSENLGTAVSFTARLEGPDDTLVLYTRYNQQESDGITSADELKVGGDYSNKFKDEFSWYVRDEGGYDNIKEIDFYNVAAAGFGYTAIDKDNWTLTARGGLSFRYETYSDPLAEELSSAGLDFGLYNEYSWETVKMRNYLTYVPSFDDFADFRATHDTHVEMPIASGPWKLRLGVSNDYRSEPPSGLKEMDTTWYTRLVLTWD